MRRIVLGLAVSMLAACATSGKFKENMQSYIGKPIDVVVSRLGYPGRQIQAPNGNLVYVYEKSRSIALPTTTTTNASVTGYRNSAYGTATTTSYGGGSLGLGCAVFFEVDASKTVVQWHAEGNDCKAM